MEGPSMDLIMIPLLISSALFLVHSSFFPFPLSLFPAYYHLSAVCLVVWSNGPNA